MAVGLVLSFVLTSPRRFGLLLHLHDDRRGRREESVDTKIPGCVSADSQGQLRVVASCPDPQLPGRSHPIPDRKPSCSFFVLFYMLTLDQPFVSSVGIAWTAYLSLTNSAEEV